MKPGEVVDMAEMFELLLLDIITVTTFDQNSLNFMKNRSHPLREAVNGGLLCVMDRIVNPWKYVEIYFSETQKNP